MLGHLQRTGQMQDSLIANSRIFSKGLMQIN